MGIFTRNPAPSALPYSAHRPITASAQRLRLRDQSEIEALKRRSQVQWQRLSWDYYDAVAEIKFAFGLLGNVTSRIRLYPAAILSAQEIPTALSDVPDDTLSPDIKEATTTLLARISSSKGGQPALLREMAIGISVPGECYLVQEPPQQFPTPVPEDWNIRSTDELTIDSMGRPAIKSRSDMRQNEYKVLPQNTFVGRIWRSHPRWSDESDSSMKGVLDLCADLLLLTRAARATARSRLNAGAMYIPDGLSASAITDGPQFTTDPENPAAPAPPDEDHDEFEDELIAAIVTPIQDEESAAAVAPLLIRGPAELGDKIKQFKFERSFDPALAERADRILERIMQGIDVPKDIVTGLANVRYALSTDTEILTRDGWRTYDQVQVGEDVLTLNHITGRSEWQPLLQINVHDIDDGPLLSMESRNHSSLSTPEHQWAIIKTGRKVPVGTERRWTTSEQGFTSTDRIPTAAECGNLPIDPKYTDDFVRLVALHTSDGTYDASGRIRIAKTDRNRNPDVLQTIRGIIAFIDPQHSEYAYSSTTPHGAAVTGRQFRLSAVASSAVSAVCIGPEKVVSHAFINALTLSQLHLFLDALIEIGDGVTPLGPHHRGLRRYWQQNKDRLEPIALAAILSGHTVRWLKTPGEAHGPVTTSRPIYGLTVTRKHTRVSPHDMARGRSEGTGVSWEHFTGKVWCPTTTNSTWLARRNGTVYYTGNSNAIAIDETLYKAHVEPLALLISDAITSMWIRPALRELGFEEADIRRVTIWYDPSEVVMKPDKSDDADAGYDRYLISAAAWRRAHGFIETDAPPGEELAYRMLVDKGQILPETSEMLLTHFAPDAMGAIRGGPAPGAAPTPQPGTPGSPDAAPALSGLPPEVQQALGLPGAPPAAAPGPVPDGAGAAPGAPAVPAGPPL